MLLSSSSQSCPHAALVFCEPGFLLFFVHKGALQGDSMLRPFVQLLKAILSAICRVEGGLAGKHQCLQSFEELLLDCHGSDTVLLTVCFLH